MPEILTESFCERCGTRYTFQAAAAARGPMTRVRNLTKGFRNYVLSDETSLSEAMATARSDDLRRTSGEQLDAFHKAFNFCMSCRQYTCANCWNDIEGRCLSCAPTADSEPLAAPYGLLEQLIGLPAADAANGNGHAVLSPDVASNGHVEAPIDGADVSAWPSIDLAIEPGPETADGVAATAEPATSAEPDDAGADPDTDAAEQVPVDMGISAERFAAMFGAPSLATPEIEPTAAIGAEAAVEAGAPEAAAGTADAVEVDTIAAEPTEPAVVAVAAEVEPVAVIETVAEPEAAAEAAAYAETEVVAEVEAEVEPDADQIHDLDGWAASAAAQTSTLLNRFRAFPAKLGATSPADVAAPDPDSAPLAAQADAPDLTDGPLAVELPAAAVDVVPVIDLFADRHPTPIAAPIIATAAAETAPIAADAETAAADTLESAPSAGADAATDSADEPPVAAETAASEPIVDVAPEPAPEAIAAETELETQPEPTSSVIEPEPEPVLPVAAAAPVAPPAPTTPIWQIVAPDAVSTPAPTLPPVPSGQPTWPPLAQKATVEPQWPTAPSWPARQSNGNVVSGADAVWAQSSRDLLNRPETGVQACINCGLPLSARARFCRRCGTNQVASA